MARRAARPKRCDVRAAALRAMRELWQGYATALFGGTPSPAAPAIWRGEMMRVVLAQPRGFCAGVERAIEIVERALEKYGPPIYVRHEIVHNRHVVERLRAKGARVRRRARRGPARRGDDLQRPWRRQRDRATRPTTRGLPVIDATCPLVSKVHNEGQRYAAQGREIVLIGHAGHPEVEGTIGQITGRGASGLRPPTRSRALQVADPDKLAYITQTTLSASTTRAASSRR